VPQAEAAVRRDSRQPACSTRVDTRRALVHRDDHRAQALCQMGIDVVVGDLREIASIAPAMDGVRRGFFTYPVQEGLLDAASAFAAAAYEQQVEQVVTVSQLAPSPTASTPRMRQHWVAEHVFDWAAVGAVHLRAAVFYEALQALVTNTIDGEYAQLALPLGGLATTLPLVGAEDVGQLAAAILQSPDGARPGSCAWSARSSPSAKSSTPSARQLTTRELRRGPSAAWQQAALERGLNPHAAEHLTKLWYTLRTDGTRDHSEARIEIDEVVEQLLGRAPRTLAEFLEDHSGGSK
jgi:uncharacterized protein YbjT (DUF2867 family)